MSVDLLKTIPQYLMPKRSMSTLAGCLADVRCTWIKNYLILRFIETYDVNMSEALIEDPKAYGCFNDFFIRRLKPECRPLAQAEIISPVDGCVSELGGIQKGQLIQAKGREYSVQELLDCSAEEAQEFLHGQFATLYLAPKDYHRVHIPMDARLQSMTYIPGALFSVQPTTTRIVPKLFARNERVVMWFQTGRGPMVLVMVGATIVGSIGTSWQGELKRSSEKIHFDYTLDGYDRTMLQGEEVGYFKLGSTVILLFAEQAQVEWNKHLKAGSVLKLGEAISNSLCSRSDFSS